MGSGRPVLFSIAASHRGRRRRSRWSVFAAVFQRPVLETQQLVLAMAVVGSLDVAIPSAAL